MEQSILTLLIITLKISFYTSSFIFMLLIIQPLNPALTCTRLMHFTSKRTKSVWRVHPADRRRAVTDRKCFTDRKCYLDGGVGLPVLLTGGSRETAVRRTLTAVPEPEATLGDGDTHTHTHEYTFIRTEQLISWLLVITDSLSVFVHVSTC